MWWSFKNAYNCNQEIMFLEVYSGNNQETHKSIYSKMFIIALFRKVKYVELKFKRKCPLAV